MQLDVYYDLSYFTCLRLLPARSPTEVGRNLGGCQCNEIGCACVRSLCVFSSKLSAIVDNRSPFIAGINRCPCFKFRQPQPLDSISMPQRNRHLALLQPLGDDVFAVLSQLSGVADTETMLEDFSYFFQCQARDFRIEEINQDPADTTDGGVEAKGARRGHAFHHGEEGGRDYDVGTPAGTVVLVSRVYLGKSTRLKLLTKSGTLSPWHGLPWGKSRSTSTLCYQQKPHRRRRTK